MATKKADREMTHISLRLTKALYGKLIKHWERLVARNPDATVSDAHRDLLRRGMKK